MAMQQCPNGHLYDDAKNGSCPFCSNGSNISVTVPLSDGMSPQPGAFPPTAQLDNFGQGYQQIDPVPATMPLEPKFEATTYKDDVINEKGIVEVRGWLVCLEGEKRGVDFKIHSEKNTIGRGTENDIKIDFDKTVSMGVNAIISYDLRNNKFFIFLGESKNNIYVNDQLLMIPIELKDYDVIEVGQTKLLFRSLCNDQFTWEATRKSADKAE